MSAQWKYGCALIAAVFSATLFTQGLVRQAGAAQAAARTAKWGRLLELENKRRAAMEEADRIQSSRGGALDDDQEKALANQMLHVAFLTPDEEYERNVLRDELQVPSASIPGDAIP